ncbi:MAG: iron ABC transporter permease [Deltaproteobacteria bacterium]|nr:MAG: iron ABC transporter permease [Deltaproteobacteria bacterium]
MNEYQIEKNLTVQSKRRSLLFVVFAVVLLVSVAVNIMVGTIDISFSELFKIIHAHDTTTTNGFIVWKIRIPRTIAAVLGGAYLSVSGLLLQVFFRNPIVGPFILGISSGAILMVSVVMLTTLSLGLTALAPFLTTISALAGAYAAMTIVLFIAAKVKNTITLLIAGLMMGYMCHAVTSVLVAFAKQEKLKMFVLWQLGSFSGFKWSEIQILFIFGGMILILVYALSKPLNAFLLGEAYASTMGVNIRVFRFFIIFCSCALAGIVTAAAGPVAFIGLAVPHMTRLCFVTSDNRILIPGAVLLGAIVTGLCDLVARLAFSPVELPISSITAFFGAPIVISLLIRRKVSV